ncbi:hypothetical protein D5F01_LYC12685 [Larimichthys crocea]|uniref:Extracellular matrix protein 1 n=1 Tax=Larimichthys crocea TaxID=215358 RepID=A0A6G0IBE0_LARCR|nr:hypothetical protein D5F01_LYC12685 [Larimichthys crocea]
MGSSRALACSIAFVLILLSSASKDEQVPEQRDVTFDFDKIMQEIQDPDLFMQKEVDLSDILDPKEFPAVQMMSPAQQYDTMSETGSYTPVLKPRGRQRFSPRSFGGPPQEYPVQFPLARPSSDNLQAICLNGDRRPRYPQSYFPPSYFSKQRREGSAVNEAESWFSTCCKGNETWGLEATLCCATQAWELSVHNFCEADASVKDRLYECCRKRDNARLNCFHNDSPNPNYEATEELPVPPLPNISTFSFDPSTCQSNQKLRPLYTVKCLPGSGYEGLGRQAKTINRIEKGFKQCCKKKQGVLDCAEQKWQAELNRFCTVELAQQGDFQCCSMFDEDRYNCFQNTSPHPHYNVTSDTEELSLNKICDTHKIIKKKFSVGLPVKAFVNQCCPLSEQEKTSCLTQRVRETSEKLCLSKKASAPAFRRCCKSRETPQCLSKILMDAVTKASNVQKKKKKCPLS